MGKRNDYSCTRCDKKLTSQHGMQNHMTTMHADNGVSCSICGKSFACRDYLLQHQKTHRDRSSRKVACQQCDKVYLTVQGLKLHLLRGPHSREGDLDEKPFTCSYCNKTFWSSTELTGHVRTHTGERPYKCGECGVAFSCKSHCGRHWKSAHGLVNMVRCTWPGCRKTLKDEGCLRQHLKTHSATTRLNCPHDGCPKTYKNERGVRAHIRVHHNKELKYGCTYCDQKFSTAVELDSHVAVHTGEKAFPCPKCPSRFARQSARWSHEIRIHRMERNHGCQHCEKRFKSQVELKTHVEIHKNVGERQRFACTVCKKMLSSKGNLQQHMVIHMDRKQYPHACQFCDKKFAARGSLVYHLRNHLGERL